MDNQIKKLIDQKFSVAEAKVIEKMLNIVNDEMLDAKKAKRQQELEKILHEVVE